MIVTPQAEPRSRSVVRQLASLVLFAFGGIGIGLAVSAVTRRPAPQPLKELAEHVLVEGRETQLPVEIANFFRIPNEGEPLAFRIVDAGSHDGRRHSIAARKRPDNGHVDILLNDMLPTGEGYHYLTAPHGRCVMALYAEDVMRPVPDAKERFDAEVRNWLDYLKSAQP